MELVVSTAAVDTLEMVVTKVSLHGGRLLISNRAFNSSSIVIACADSREMIPS
jgi:hypothetical protein